MVQLGEFGQLWQGHPLEKEERKSNAARDRTSVRHVWRKCKRLSLARLAAGAFWRSEGKRRRSQGARATLSARENRGELLKIVLGAVVEGFERSHCGGEERSLDLDWIGRFSVFERDASARGGTQHRPSCAREHHALGQRHSPVRRWRFWRVCGDVS